MKVGMIFECGPVGADRKVCEHLIKMLDPSIKVESVTLDNKKNLVSECAKSAINLLKGNCDRVVIMWDLQPSWHESPPCRKKDRDDILLSLTALSVELSKVFLVCIEAELEAWLLADNRAIETVLSKPHRQIRIDRERRPEQIPNPKKRLMQIFREQGKRPYNDMIDAEKIIKAMPDLERLKKVETFKRFALKVADIEL